MTEFEMFAEAVAFAARKHRFQTRNDGVTPYIYHPMKVAEIVRIAGGDLKTQIVAVLHDTLEDTDATEAEILQFGPDVLEAVMLVTRPKGADEAEYVERILKNPMAAMVKNADKLHNTSEAPFCEDQAWAKHYLEKSRKYYYGKFSKAVDQRIARGEAILSGDRSAAAFLPACPEDLTLYGNAD